MMERREEEEKDIIMNDPKLRAVIEKLAEGSGFSPEEYYDQFEAMIKDHPEILEDIISRSFDNQRKKNSEENDNR